MAGTGDPFLDQIIARRSQFGINTGGGFGVGWQDAEDQPVMPLQLGGQTLAVPEETLSPEELAELTGLALPQAQPEDGSGFSFFDALIDTLDIPGAFVRGLTGAGLSALQGKMGEAGQRVLSAFPGSETIAPMLGLGKGTAPTGEDLLVDLGMTRGSTSEDERRVRLAKQAGMSESEARQKFGRFGDAKMDVQTSREFDALMDSLKGQEGLDLGVTWEDAKNAADFGDVAGIGVEVLTDPLTYMTMGASAAGKAAAAVKGLEKSANIALKTGKMAAQEHSLLTTALKSLKNADSLEGALTALKGAKLPEKQMGRLEDLLSRAWREGKPNLDLADTWGKQARAGQREISFMGKKIASGEGIFEKLSVLGESDTARALRQAQPDKFGKSHEGGRILEKLRSWFQPVRTALSGKTGLEALDEAAELGRIATRTGLTEKGRELSKLGREFSDLAKAKGIGEGEAVSIWSRAVELGADNPKVLSELAGAGFKADEVAPFAAGITKVNKEIADKLHQVPLPFKELDDDTLDYLHRSMTPEAKDWLKNPKNAAAFEEKTGLKYNARAGIFQQRVEAWKGKAISEINSEMVTDFKVKQFFHEDPAWATRKMVNQAQRAIGNAVFGEEVIQRFGRQVPEGYKGVTALDVYKKLGLQVPEDAKAVADLAQTAIPEEIYKFVVQAAEIQKAPGKFFKTYKAITDWMKATVTVLFPAFHGRNMLENTFKNVVEGNVDPKNYTMAGQLLALAADTNSGGPGFVDRLARSAKGIIQKGGKYDVELQKLFKENGLGNTAEEAIDWMFANGVLENRIAGEFGAVLRDGPAAAGSSLAAKQASGALGGLLGTQGAPIRAGFALASGTENWHRVSMFIDRLRKGLSSAEAVTEVKRVFFDYRDLSQWESKFVQNYGFFYNFYRNNLRYITQQTLEHPVRTKALLEAFSDDPDNPRFRWLSQKGALKLGAADVSLGFLPQQQFGMFNLAEGDVFDKVKGKMGEAIGSMNPMISNAANLAYGQDLYSNTPLEYKTRAADLSAAPQWLQKLVGYEQTTTGESRVNWKVNAFIAFVPAFARMMQSATALTEKDKDYMQKLTRVFAGVGVTYKDAEELRKRDLELIDRNIQREAKSLKNLREVGKASYAIDPKTRDGRILAALAHPSKDNVKDLLTDNEIGARIMPHITIGPNGEPVINRFLRDVIDETFREKYPEYAALFDAQRLRRKLRLKSKDQLDLEADEIFEQMFGPTGE